MLNVNPAASSQNVNFYVTVDESSDEPRFGIKASVKDDEDDTEITERRFFTEGEAERCCKWLAENDVYPITLNEVLHDLYL